jgi:APA family basic amino acid/polyamine antiporter
MGEQPVVGEKLFVRKATGLVREIGLLTSILITLSFTIGLGWQKRVFQFSGPAIVPSNQYFAGINPMVMAFLLVGVVVLFSIYAFGAMTAAMPRSGGGYVTISRVLHPYLGYMGAWMEFLATAISFGLIAVAVMEVVVFLFPSLIGLNNSFWTTGNPAVAEGALIGIGLIVVAFFTGIAMLGVGLTGKLLQVLFWIPAVLTVGVYALLISSSPAAVSAGLSNLFHLSNPSDLTNYALSHGMGSYSGGYWGAVGVAILGAYWAYEGYAASTFVAGEVKEANKNLPRSLFIAALVIIGVYTTASALLYRSASSVGQVTTSGGNTFSFFDAWAYLSYGSHTLGAANTALGSSLPSAWLPFNAAAIASGIGAGWFVPLLVIFALFWVMNDIPPFILTASRIIFAMSFDRILPSRLSNINERFHSPVWAVAFTGIIAIVGVVGEAEGDYGQIANFSPALSSIVANGVPTTDLEDMIFFSLFALTAIILPFKRKDIYERSPFKPSIGGFPLLALIGLVAFLGNLYLIWVELNAGYSLSALGTALFSADAFNSGVSSPFWSTVGIAIVLTIFYFAYRNYNKKSGVNYHTIYTEIPPE